MCGKVCDPRDCDHQNPNWDEDLPAPCLVALTKDGHVDVRHGTVDSPIHCRYEAITSFGNGLYVERMFGIIAERSSNLSYRKVEASLIIDESVGAPNFLNNSSRVTVFPRRLTSKTRILAGCGWSLTE